jgi:hypothetical protein
LGFGGTREMGRMHDTLQYLQRDTVHRAWHHGEITFRSVYMGSEHYVLTGECRGVPDQEPHPTLTRTTRPRTTRVDRPPARANALELERVT